MATAPNMAINMTMPRGMTEPSRLRRGITSVLAAAVVLPVVVYLSKASTAVTVVRAQRESALIAPAILGASAPGSSTSVAARGPVRPQNGLLTEAMIRKAIAARPLDQVIANVAMVWAVKGQAPQGSSVVVANGKAEKARLNTWMPVVARLGWRDTAAQFNRLYVAAATGDIVTVMDVSESLLRRQRGVDQITPVLAIAETDPQISLELIARLQRKPGWRAAYLVTTNVLVRPDQRVARYKMLRELMRRGDRLGDDEVFANVTALERGALPNLGFALLKAARPGVTSPLNDPEFRRAATNSAGGVATVPYDWQLLTGEGFSTDAFIENGQSSLEIKWNGRGVPVFARQRTSAGPGRYVLDIGIEPHTIADIAAVQFRLVCDGTVIGFRQDGPSPTRLSTLQPVPCAYPVFEIAGEVQSSSMPRTVALHALRLRPVA